MTEHEQGYRAYGALPVPAFDRGTHPLVCWVQQGVERNRLRARR